MKILHVIPSLGVSLGGPSQVAMNLVKALRDLSIDTEIIATNYDHPQPLDVPLNQRVDYCFESGSVPVWFLPYNPPAVKEFIFSKALTIWCWQHLHRYDVLDNHYLFSYASTCAAAIAHRKKIPYTIRTMGQLSPWALAQSRVKKQLYTALIERRNLHNAAAIHCTTPAEADDVRSFGINTPTITLPLGVNLPEVYPNARAELRQKYRIPSDTPVVLFLSRLHYKKRPDLLLESLSYLKAQRFCFHAIFAGSGEVDYLAQLKNLTTSLGLDDCVSFPGLVVGKDKDLLLQGSDLFVLPSFSENFGIAVAEALVAGCPVVITPGIQIAPDIASAQAGFVVEGAKESVAEAIAQLLKSPELRHEYGMNGQRLARERYSWRAIAQELTTVYQAIIDRQPLSH
ncbi:glycosyltransferase [Oculatella sp. LEGE 06141]|uniref:glycosyltransferase n=1 Tax=Oculatella sp. LEGE 06141 TaxID=1828648 RepID=UPI00187F6812|nr:glycosyltransferase [Oculatella sp. LEGE 06141]MBE9179528.1 glycosyltransferase [Oculatella sp. LEGE 06141]